MTDSYRIDKAENGFVLWQNFDSYELDSKTWVFTTWEELSAWINSNPYFEQKTVKEEVNLTNG